MIQATTKTNFTAYIQTEDNRIKTSVGSNKIRHLLKFTNDMDGSVVYAYGTSESINERYTKLTFTSHTTPDVYTGKVNLSAGYWKYEAYEVWFVATVNLTPTFAPVTEDEVLTTEAAGVVQGLVTKGKMYVAEKDGMEEVQYTEYDTGVVKLNIIFGGTTYGVAPTIVIAEPPSGRRATATCTIEGGAINSVTITNQGWGYTEAPQVTLSGGETTNHGVLTASLKDNYIYYG